MRTQELAKRAKELIDMADEALKTERRGEWGRWVDYGMSKGFRSASLSFLLQLFGRDHPYFKEFDAVVDGSDASDIQAGRSVLAAALNEIEGGWLQTLKGLVSAEIFADFLEMSTHLLEEGYKDPAAVMTGSILEEHLRQLCMRSRIDTETLRKGMPVPKRADRLNADLAKASVYSKLDQKSITSWLGLRNSAAHGKYSDYSKDQVGLMIQGVRDFMTRHQA